MIPFLPGEGGGLFFFKKLNTSELDCDEQGSFQALDPPLWSSPLKNNS
jgi:hypothetical protein